MCRYGMSSYKPHYACFNCRKAFKRKLLIDVDRNVAYKNEGDHNPSKCPQCDELMADMGLDFEAPKNKDIKVWKHISSLYKVGITYHSCGCSGPGYIPSDTSQLIAFFEEKLTFYNQELFFWRERETPTSKREIDREHSTQWKHLQKLPASVRGDRKQTAKSQEAIDFWIKKTKEIESKIALVHRK